MILISRQWIEQTTAGLFKSVIMLLGLLLLPALFPTLTSAQPKNEPSVVVYHYNPESHGGRSLVLKNTFDHYFQSKGNLQLQPVEDKSAFHEIVGKTEAHLYIVSHWDFQQLAKTNADLTPYFRGRKSSSDTFRKLLVSASPAITKNPNQRPTIAISGSQEYVQNILKNMIYEKRLAEINHPRFLSVPKDIDALLAVSFGLADAALATENNVEKLSQLYVKEYQQLTILGTSQPQKRMVVVVNKRHLDTLKEALDIIEAMDKNHEGKLGLNLLGLDSWKKLPRNGRSGQ